MYIISQYENKIQFFAQMPLKVYVASKHVQIISTRGKIYAYKNKEKCGSDMAN